MHKVSVCINNGLLLLYTITSFFFVWFYDDLMCLLKNKVMWLIAMVKQISIIAHLCFVFHHFCGEPKVFSINKNLNLCSSNFSFGHIFFCVKFGSTLLNLSINFWCFIEIRKLLATANSFYSFEGINGNATPPSFLLYFY